MMRWLLGVNRPITEPAIEVLSEQEIQCTPRGQVMLLDGARSVYDLNQDYEKQLATRREKQWSELDRVDLLNHVRQTAGIRTLEEIPEPKVQTSETVRRQDYQIADVTIETEDDIRL